jgi:hypothetical protein
MQKACPLPELLCEGGKYSVGVRKDQLCSELHNRSPATCMRKTAASPLAPGDSPPTLWAMPDPLDPTDAIVSAFTDIWKRCGAFLAVTAGAAFLGWNIHNAPNVIANFGTLGFGAIRQVYESIDPSLAAGWFMMMAHSLFILWTLPFALLYLWLLAKLFRDGDLFQILVLLAVAHPIHTFIYLQRVDPINGPQLAGAIGMLLFAEIVTMGLIIWWRHVSENAPLETPDHGAAEPEL